MTPPRWSVGLDLGDGESAVAWADCRGHADVRLFEAEPGRVGVVTALARGPFGERLFGEAALRQPEPREVRITFKHRPVPLTAGLLPPSDAAEFAALLLSDFAGRHPEVVGDCCVHVGHPAGWDRPTVDVYRSQLHAALQPLSVVLVPEPQSAFLHVLDEGRSDPTARPALVVDVGSSTTDFTLVTDTARNLPFGGLLGGRLIDEAIAERVIAQLDDPAARERLQRPTPGALLRWLARRTKEAHFEGRAAEPVDSPAGSELRWVVDTCGPLLTGLAVGELVAAPGGWRDALRTELARVRDALGAELPLIVLTSGGGSRMPFVGGLCREAFPEAAVDPVADPSLAVARGLASYGRWRTRVEAFRTGVTALADRERIDAVVTRHVPRMRRALADFGFRQLYPVAYRPILDEIAAGGDPRLLLTVDAAVGRLLAWLDSPAGAEERELLLGPLEHDLDLALQPEANRLCRESALAEGSLGTRVRLPSTVFAASEGLWRSAVDALTPVLAATARNRAVRAYLRASYWGYSFARPFVPPPARRAVIPGAALVELGSSIADEVRAQLFARSREVEQLLV